MRYLTNSVMAKRIDEISINEIGIPSEVLMERAAMAVTAAIKNNTRGFERILVLCGTGNNGADGIAVARMLSEMGYYVDVFTVMDEAKATREYSLEKSIATKLGIRFVKEVVFEFYNAFVDAIFGIGLTRPITGEISDIITKVNNSNARVFSVDIPSGINASDGTVMGNAIIADYTVTFGTNKIGLVVGKGCAHAGNIVVADIGFPRVAINYICGDYFYYSIEELKSIVPKRRTNTNKGSYGKISAFLGQKNMSGAAYLCASAALRSGTGMVKVISAKENSSIILGALPVALFDEYDLPNGELNQEAIDKAIAFANVIVIGPGLGTGELSTEIFKYVVRNSGCNIIIDADGINILAMIKESKEGKEIFESLRGRSIITPHVVEMARISGLDKEVIKEDIVKAALDYSEKSGIITVLKDFRTVVSDGKRCYINVAGNNGMATAGSGDVLCGIIAAMHAQGLELFEAAASGSYIHGLAGDKYANTHNRYSLNATDIIDCLCEVLPE